MKDMFPYNVLIVDDSAAMRRFVRRVLEISGLAIGQLNEAQDGMDALKFLAKNAVDLILTDINMPVMGGEEFMAQIASQAAISAIPVVVISTDSTRRRKNRMMALGASGYLAKPFSPEKLRTELERVLAGRLL